MPKKLPDRWMPESIQEFRASARQRYDDGRVLAAGDRRTGAIYMWGYSAEMILKAAYFALNGVNESTDLGWSSYILPAIKRGRSSFGISWPHFGQGHNVQAWAELLIAERTFLGKPYSISFGLELQTRGQRIGHLWSEQLRYHKNVAYPFEAKQMHETTKWFLGIPHAGETVCLSKMP